MVVADILAKGRAGVCDWRLKPDIRGAVGFLLALNDSQILSIVRRSARDNLEQFLDWEGERWGSQLNELIMCMGHQYRLQSNASIDFRTSWRCLAVSNTQRLTEGPCSALGRRPEVLLLPPSSSVLLCAACHVFGILPCKPRWAGKRDILVASP